MSQNKNAKTETLTVQLRIPRLIVDTRHRDPKELVDLGPALQSLNARVTILGHKIKGLKSVFSLEQALEEADIWLILDEKPPKEFNDLIEKGIVPVLQAGVHQKAVNYNPVAEEGNAFLFEKNEIWSIHHALVRATENFAFSYDWGNLKKHGQALL